MTPKLDTVVLFEHSHAYERSFFARCLLWKIRKLDGRILGIFEQGFDLYLLVLPAKSPLCASTAMFM
jgi:hypothetical protein